ncbi:MAG TPA: hypothetical protein VGH99_22000 [Pseudonocardia sp.]
MVERGVGWFLGGDGGDGLSGVLRGEAETDERLDDVLTRGGLGTARRGGPLKLVLVRYSRWRSTVTGQASELAAL